MHQCWLFCTLVCVGPVGLSQQFIITTFEYHNEESAPCSFFSWSINSLIFLSWAELGISVCCTWMRCTCSREKFGEMHARLWWEENRARVHKQYLWIPPELNGSSRWSYLLILEVVSSCHTNEASSLRQRQDAHAHCFLICVHMRVVPAAFQLLLQHPCGLWPLSPFCKTVIHGRRIWVLYLEYWWYRSWNFTTFRLLNYKWEAYF